MAICRACAADCGVPLLDRNVKLYYSSTLDGSVLILTCENNNTTNEQILIVMCRSNGSWIPNPTSIAAAHHNKNSADLIKSCSSSMTVQPGIVHSVHMWIVGLCFVKINQSAWFY